MNALRWLLPLIVGAAFVFFWAMGALMTQDPAVLPGPLNVCLALRKIWPELAPVIARDVLTMVSGFFLATVLGLVTAIAITTYRGVQIALTPWIAIGRMTPLLVLAPVFIVSPLPNVTTLILVTTVICYFPMVAILAPAFRSTDKILLDLFQTYRATHWQEIVFLRLPHALPSLMRALRRAAILAPLATILTDFLEGTLAGQPGLGLLLHQYHALGDRAATYALCLFATLTGVVLAGAVDAFAAWVLAHWHANDHEHH